MDLDNNQKDNNQNKEKIEESDVKEVKMEICYTCGKEFDMNSDEGAHYHYGEYPMCGYCTNFFGFYKEDLMDENIKKE
ncbi:MAG: hypothetical protein IKV87_07020 [Methanobrevibacter sp.]|nr:hypothetical protein [Methanobrevibacter sp.]